MATNNISKVVGDLLQDLVSRQAAQGHQAGPPAREWATTTRRQTPLPQVSQRSAQLLQQIVDQGKRGKPGTSSGSSWASGPVQSRADMIASRDPSYIEGPGAQRYGPSLPQQETPSPIPQYESFPDLRIRGVEGRPDLQTRQYAAPPPAPQGLPAPTDKNGIPYPNWESLTPEQQVAIYSSMGLSTPEQVQVQADATRTPPTQEAPIIQSIIDRKKEEKRIADPYGEQFLPENAPGIPGFGLQTGNAPLLTEAIKAQQKADTAASGLPEFDVTLPTPEHQNPDGSPDAAWLAMTPEAQAAAWEVQATTPPDSGGFAPDPVTAGMLSGASWAGKELWNAPGHPIQTLMEVIDTVSGSEEVRRSTAGTAYHMATHDGERPPQTLTSGWMGSVADVIGSSAELLKFMAEHGMKLDTTATGNALSGISMINYLDAHPEVLPDIKRVYEYQISLGASEAEAEEAVWNWFYEQQGIVTQLIAEGLWDPSWLIPIGGVAGRVAKFKAADQFRRGDTAAAATSNVIGKVLAGPQDIMDVAGALPGKIIKGGWNKNPLLRDLTSPSDGVARQTGQESVETAADIARREGGPAGNTAEEIYIQGLAAEAKIATQAENVKRAEAYKRMWFERANKAEDASTKAAAYRAAKEAAQEEKAAQKELDRLIFEASRRDMPSTLPLESATTQTGAPPVAGDLTPINRRLATGVPPSESAMSTGPVVQPGVSTPLKPVNRRLAPAPGVPPSATVPSTGPVGPTGQSLTPINRRLEPTTAPAPGRPLTAESSVDEIFDGSIPNPQTGLYRLPEGSVPDHVNAQYEDAARMGVSTFDNAPVESVPLNDPNVRIIATQQEFQPGAVQRYLDNPNLLSETSDMPYAIKDGHTYYITDGTSRTGAARIRGDDAIDMRVIDATPAGAVDEVTEDAGPLFRNLDSMNYLAPTNPLKTRGGQLNLAGRVQKIGETYPQAARAFADEYEPMAIKYIQDNPPKGPQTPQSVINDVTNRVETEELFVKHFRQPSGYYDNGGFRVRDANTKQGMIERSVMGTDQESAAAFNGLQRATREANHIITDKTISDLRGLRSRYQATKSGSVSRNVDTSIPASTSSGRVQMGKYEFDSKPFSSNLTNAELERMAVHGSVDDLTRNLAHAKRNRGSATQARAELRRRFNANEWDGNIDDLARQRSELYPDVGGTINRNEDFQRVRGLVNPPPSPGSTGIVINPVERAKRIFQGHSNRIEDAKMRTLDHSIPGSAAAPPPASIDNWVDSAEESGDIVKSQRKHLETPTKITITRNGEKVEETWTFVARLEDNVGRQRKAAMEKAKNQVEFRETRGKGHIAEITDERVDEIIADLNKTWNDDYETALNKTKKEFLATYTDTRTRGQANRAWHAFQNYHRQNIQFNIVNGTSAALQDWTNNAWIAFLHGEWGAARNVVKIQRKLWREVPEGTLLEDILPQADLLKSQGQLIPKKYHGGGFGRAQLEQTGKAQGSEIWTEALARRNVLGNLLKPLAMPVIKKLRVTGDEAWRIAVFINAHARETVFGHANFMKRIYQKADELGDLTLADDIRALGLDGGFKPDDVRGVLRDHGITDDTLARQWANELNTRYDNAMKKTDKLYFTYQKTKIDDALSQVFMFHYFMTRSAPQHIQYLLQHPALALVYWNWWENKEAFANEAAPPWMKSWVQFAKSHGMYMMADPMSFFMGFTTFASFGEQGGYNDTLVEKFANRTGLFFAPNLRAALALAGLNKPGDITATNKIRKAVLAAANYIRNSDEDWVPDVLKDPGFSENHDIIQNITDSVYGVTSKWFEEKGLPFAKAQDPDSVLDKKKDEAEIVLTNTFEEMYGPHYDDNEDVLWTKDQEAEYVAALDDLESGQYENPYVQEAIQAVSKKDIANVGLDVVSPVQAAVRIEESDQTYQNRQAAFERQREGQPPLPGDENLMGMSDITNLQSPEARQLSSSYSQYQSLGTDRQNQLSESWNAIVYGVMDIPDDYTMTIDGETYTASTIKRMTAEERMELADSWVSQYEIPGGRAAANAKDDPDTFEDETVAPNELGKFRNDRKGMRDADPVLDDFLTYRKWMFDFEDQPGGLRSTRKDMENGNPNSEFSRAINGERERLTKDGLSGEELEVRLDNWITTEAGYAAIMGWQWKSNNDPGSALFDPLSYPWREDDATGTGAGTGFDTPYEKPTHAGIPVTSDQRLPGYIYPDIDDVDKGLDFSSMTLSEAKALIATDSISPKGLKVLVKRGLVTPEVLVQWITDGTMLKEDVYVMAAQENLTATDIRYSVEDGYLSMDDVLALIFNPSSATINRVREANRQRKRDRENKSSSSYGSGSGITPSTNLVRKYLVGN